ncbi:MAG: hypothetical protein LRY72_00255 [Saccharospirillaceae bacterium]|nr:hypothetical protein [Saccharospirillaceae bacterium]
MRLFPLLIPVCFLSGCLSDPDEDTNISPIGVSLVFQADLPYGEQQMVMAAAAYVDGRPELLVGGDVLKVTADSVTSLLRENSSEDTFLRGNMPGSSGQSLQLVVAHDPLNARSERWYPAEKAWVDAGAGSLVGFSAVAVIPQELIITSPQTGTVFASRNNDIALSWSGSGGDEVKLVSTQSCYSGRDVIYGRYVHTMADSGTYTLTVGDIIPSEGALEAAGVVNNVVISFLDLMINIFVSGLGFGEPRSVNIRDFNLQYCTLDLALYRMAEGTLGAGVSGGKVSASRSDRIRLEYRP